MNAMQLIMHRDDVLPVRSVLHLADHDLLRLTLAPGDTLRSDRGTVWITRDGDLNDIVLEPGESYRVRETDALNVSALDSACLSVRTERPLAWQRMHAERGGLWPALRRLVQRDAAPQPQRHAAC